MREVPKKYEAMQRKVKTSRKAAIRLFCLECMGWQEKEVPGCTDKDCVFYSRRLSG